MIRYHKGSIEDLYIDIDNRFMESFDRKKGKYIRTGIIDREGTDTGIDPFKRSYPNLLDVGIMGSCVHGRSGLCVKAGVQCYQNGLGVSEPDMSYEDYQSIIEQVKGKVMQCLHKDEIVISKSRGAIRIYDVEFGEMIFDGEKYVKVVGKSVSANSAYKITIDGNRSIVATSTHTFPVISGERIIEKKLGDILVGDRMLIEQEKTSNYIDKINIAEILTGLGFGERFNVRISGKRSVKLSKYSGNFSEEIVRIGVERSRYTVDSVIDVSPELMRILGYYVGDGSKRSYVMGKPKARMLEDLKRCLMKVFPNFDYKEVSDDSKDKIELGSKILHKIIFDVVFGCRNKDGEKTLPNFIFNVSQEMVLNFLCGYFCDGNLSYDSTNGASITFNTSSKPLANGLMALFPLKFGIPASISTESGAKTYEKSFGRYLSRKDRYRIRVYNNLDLEKIMYVAKYHHNYSDFSDVVNSVIGSKNSRKYKNNTVLKIEQIEDCVVVDIEVKSDKHLFITSNGIVSHNCALGGRGDPNKHKFFGDILKLTYNNVIIPNYTTSGLGLTDGEVEVTKRFCGAAAVSWYRSDYTVEAIEKFVKAGVTTNIHYVISNSSIQEAIERLRNNSFPKGVNAVIFLMHKPVGLGSQSEVLKADNPLVKEFFGIVDSWDGEFKIGFDSCSIPGILNFTSNIDLQSLDTCEGARFSAYITSDMIMTPCSFDNQDLKYGVSLRDYSIQDAWNSEKFNQFRDKLTGRCTGCAIRNSCMGGCPLKPEIVLCEKENRSEN